MSQPRANSTAVRALAREIHRCPEGYEGPCWGPTREDIAQALRTLAQHDPHCGRDHHPDAVCNPEGGSS